MTTRDVALVQQLLDLRKPYFTLGDLEKILGQQRPSLYVTLNRLVNYGVLTRLRRGVYQAAMQTPALPRIANALVYPSYLSFESALSRFGILSVVPPGLQRLPRISPIHTPRSAPEENKKRRSGGHPPLRAFADLWL
ncbi:MAG: type IV toxin-antitoxin system AbiEi family antitoxin domain-containing protein [Anaerolineae bacterium]